MKKAVRINEDLSKKIAPAIVRYAVSVGADIIVMEHLDFIGQKPKHKKQRLHMWRNRDIQKIVMHQAHRNGIRVRFVNARNTSRLAFDGSGEVARNSTNMALCDVEGIFTHFCVSDEEGEENVAFTKKQHERYARMIAQAEEKGNFRFRLRHCCNAGGIVSYPEWADDMVRCGIILYGSGELAERMGMEPVMALKSRVAVVRDLAPGTSVSYGRTYFTTRKSRIAVLPLGYADGLHRALSNRMEVLTPYGRAKQVGRICMDMCMIDVTDLPEVKSGDEVEIFGKNVLCAEDAAACGTIPYELLCAVSKRVPRHYFLHGERVDADLQSV